jgi:hypothetical protein
MKQPEDAFLHASSSQIRIGAGGEKLQRRFKPMENRMMYRMLAAVVFMLVAASFTFAHEVKIGERARLGDGPELKPGTYRLELVKNQDTSEAVFYKDEDLVARVPITVVKESDKSRQTEVHSELLDGGRVINEIRVAGWRERLLFREPGQTPATVE